MMLSKVLKNFSLNYSKELQGNSYNSLDRYSYSHISITYVLLKGAFNKLSRNRPTLIFRETSCDIKFTSVRLNPVAPLHRPQFFKWHRVAKQVPSESQNVTYVTFMYS